MSFKVQIATSKMCTLIKDLPLGTWAEMPTTDCCGTYAVLKVDNKHLLMCGHEKGEVWLTEQFPTRRCVIAPPGWKIEFTVQGEKSCKE